MRVIISKILNKTDLAESESHGGLVVTKNMMNPLMDFFEAIGKEQEFTDKKDNEKFQIHYADYTSNGTTPNDRVTSIGKFASKHGLMPGDNLILEKIEDADERKYYIEYVRKMYSIYFVGKSRKILEVLNYNQFTDIVVNNISNGKVKRTSPTACKMNVKYQGIIRELVISQNGDSFEMYFNGEQIGQNNKYFELNTLSEPFELKKTDTWKFEIDAGDEEEKINNEADEELLLELSNQNFDTKKENYAPHPEDKKPEKKIKGKSVPNRDTDTAKKALSRANYLCEYDSSHKLFIRKKQNINYTEPHHLIPLKYDELFEKSLDVQANIVSLCSHCHNLIHYGADAEVLIRKLWSERYQEIQDAGIGVMENGTELTLEILLGFYGMK